MRSLRSLRLIIFSVAAMLLQVFCVSAVKLFRICITSPCRRIATSLCRRGTDYIQRHPFQTMIRASAAAAALLVFLVLGLILEVKNNVHLTPPSPTPFLEDRFGNYLFEGGDADSVRGFWDVPQILPQRITSCLIAIEDKRFFEHSGVDWPSMVRATLNNITGGPRQGASTIAMQVARMQNPGPRTYRRKLVEIITAYLLTHRFGRENIMRHYLRLAPQGNQIHGFAYAARRYFRKPLQDLGWAEAALLAGIPKAPGRMNLFTPEGFRKAQDRAEIILRLLNRQGKFSDDAFHASMHHLHNLSMPVKEYRPFHSYHVILRLEEILKETAESGFTRPVRAGLDLTLQDRLFEIARRSMAVYRPMGAGNVAIMVVDKETGKIRGYLGSEFYNDSRYAGAINFAHTPRSSGSTLKPFIFALGLADKNYSSSSILADLPLTIPHASGDYSVANYDESYQGPMLYRKALANSRNIPAVQVLKSVGLERTYSFFRRLGLARDPHQAGWYGLGMAIGGLYVTLEDLVSAYGCLANDGQAFQLNWFETGVKKDQRAQQTLPEDTARQITLFLADPLARIPSFSRMGALEYPFPVAIKTGTSQGFRDAWAVAYSSEYIVGVWIGHPDNDRMKQVSGLAAAGLVKEILLYLHPDENRGVHETPFPAPRGFKGIKICPLSGQLATRHCPDVALEYFKPGTEPVTACAVHRQFAVDGRTGTLAHTDTPSRHMELKTCAILAPEYAVWAARKGYCPPPADTSRHVRAKINIREPVNGARIMLDPETPRQFQSLALKASVTPAIPEIIWIINGEPMNPTPFPYAARWPLKPGVHSFQVRFPHAAGISDPVTITVSEY